jgi:hypothetical protein
MKENKAKQDEMQQAQVVSICPFPSTALPENT